MKKNNIDILEMIETATEEYNWELIYKPLSDVHIPIMTNLYNANNETDEELMNTKQNAILLICALNYLSGKDSIVRTTLKDLIIECGYVPSSIKGYGSNEKIKKALVYLLENDYIYIHGNPDIMQLTNKEQLFIFPSSKISFIDKIDDEGNVNYFTNISARDFMMIAQYNNKNVNKAKLLSVYLTIKSYIATTTVNLKNHMNGCDIIRKLEKINNTENIQYAFTTISYNNLAKTIGNISFKTVENYVHILSDELNLIYYKTHHISIDNYLFKRNIYSLNEINLSDDLILDLYLKYIYKNC